MVSIRNRLAAILRIISIGVFCCALSGYAQLDITNASGQISAQYSDSPTGEGVQNVIDNNAGTKLLTFHGTAWIQFQASATYTIASYTITSANDSPERDPASLTLAGSLNGSAWTVLDTRTGESFAARLRKNRYTFVNSTPYTYYRLTMTSTSDILQIAEWELFSSVSHNVSAPAVAVTFSNAGATATPQVTVVNYGTNTETFPVICRIDTSGVQIYQQTQNVTGLATGLSQTVTFPSLSIVKKSYRVKAWTALANDSIPGDDTGTCVFGNSYNLAHDSIVYGIAGAHLDDQWQWTLTTTIKEYLPNTMRANFELFAAYPEYNFTFEGAYRYALMKQHYPSDYATLKSWVAKDRWHYSGTFWDPSDVNIPSAEALIRQALYGTEFSMDEFGKRSVDIYLPDCFGFGYALPTIARHCGIIGFSTQKFDLWGGWIPSPFSIGRWIGVDGSSIVASLKPGGYIGGIDIRTDDGNALKARSGIWATQDYIGTGDYGGAPSANDVNAMVNRIRANPTNSIKVVCASSDQLYRDMTPSMISALPSYTGELLMSTHGIGCYTAWASMKMKNRRNELRGAAAEFACVMGNWLTGGSFVYPIDTISTGWRRVLAMQFHDVLTGTSIPDVYAIAIPTEDSAYADFNYAFDRGNSAMANSAAQQLTTTATVTGRVPIVLVNSLAFDRCDAVQAVVTFGATAHAGVKVYDPSGVEVLAQIVGSSGQFDTIVFIAKVPSAGYSVFEAEPVAATNPANPNLSIRTSATGDTLENTFYRVVVNTNGDISSVYDKRSSHELLLAPSRLELRPNGSTSWPAWEVTYNDVSATPTGYVDQGVVTTVKESGPARVSLQVSRTKNGSTFTQLIQLAADSAGMRLDVDNAINWLTTGTLLKAGFPMSCSNDSATWDLGIGTIKRPTMTSSRYEVPGQQWADQTSVDGSYGLSILNDCKYGWNKESIGKLNLTLLHSPSSGSFGYQSDQSNVDFVGIHRFKYSFYGHPGSWTNGTVQQAAQLNQPVYAYQTTARAGAKGSREISFVKTSSPQVMVMAIKKAQKSNYYVVRVREASGAPISKAKLTFGANITSAVEMTGVEEIIPSASAITTSGADLTFDLTKYQPRTFAVTIAGSPAITGAATPGAKMHSSSIPLTVSQQNRALKIAVTLDGRYSVVINDIAGRRTCAWQGSGAQNFVVDSKKMSSGMKIVRVQAEGRIFVKKVMVY